MFSDLSLRWFSIKATSPWRITWSRPNGGSSKSWDSASTSSTLTSWLWCTSKCWDVKRIKIWCSSLGKSAENNYLLWKMKIYILLTLGYFGPRDQPWIPTPIIHGTVIFICISEFLNIYTYLFPRNYMNDALRSDVFMRHDPETVACACIYLSARYLRICLPKNPSWFAIFKVTEDNIISICKTILQLYSRPKVSQT